MYKENQIQRMKSCIFDIITIIKIIGGWKLSKNNTKKVHLTYLRNYRKHYLDIKHENRGFDVLKRFRYDGGEHPKTYIDHECEFASLILSELKPKTILDIGSYRHFIIGLLAYFHVTTIDIRNRSTALKNETVITCDAKKLEIKDNSFDSVVSLCAIEHFGLGRYGDEFDIYGDINAIKEMIRVLKPGGLIIFSTTITNHNPQIAFNAHRIYNYKMILDLCNGLTCVGELFFNTTTNELCKLIDITDKAGEWNLYCGCWMK